MEEKYAIKLHEPKITVYVEFNTGVSVIKKRDELGTLDTWTNPEGITNILYDPKL